MLAFILLHVKVLLPRKIFLMRVLIFKCLILVKKSCQCLGTLLACYVLIMWNFKDSIQNKIVFVVQK